MKDELVPLEQAILKALGPCSFENKDGTIFVTPLNIKEWGRK